MRANVVGVIGLLSALAVAACSGGGSTSNNSPGGSTATLVLAALEGDGQTATVGQAVATAPAVRATRNAQPAAGVAVTFAPATGSGSVSGGSATTDANGIARVGAWTLGTTAGAQSLAASATGASSVTFSATARAAAASVMSKASGDAQTSAAGVALSTKPAVRVADPFGNAVSGVNVTFAVTAGGGSVSGASQATGTDGVATVGGWTLGTVAGANTLSATATGITGAPLLFGATGVAGPVATMVKVAGDNQTGSVLAALVTPPAVRLADQFGNLIGGQTVNFAVASGGGSVTGATPSSAANGVATVGSWTLGPAAGTNTLTATANAQTVTFTATGAAAFNAAQYAGNYAGTWTNTTFSSTGTASATITVNGAASTASVVVAVTGQVLGTGGVNTTQNGSYAANGASLTNAAIPVMGNVTGTIDAAGNIVATGANIPNPSIRKWDATGTITSTQLRLTFTVTFTDNTTAVGTVSLNHT